jgi:hypothetical protein
LFAKWEKLGEGILLEKGISSGYEQSVEITRSHEVHHYL